MTARLCQKGCKLKKKKKGRSCFPQTNHNRKWAFLYFRGQSCGLFCALSTPPWLQSDSHRMNVGYALFAYASLALFNTVEKATYEPAANEISEFLHALAITISRLISNSDWTGNVTLRNWEDKYSKLFFNQLSIKNAVLGLRLDIHTQQCKSGE